MMNEKKLENHKKILYFLIVFGVYLCSYFLTYALMFLITLFFDIGPYVRLIWYLVNFLLAYYLTYRFLCTRWMQIFMKQI